jgi:hypothetical protein
VGIVAKKNFARGLIRPKIRYYNSSTTINQRENSSVKWTYKECVVIITAAAFGSPASFRPIVKIDCNSRDPPTGLTTGQTFLTTEQASEFGQDMAREWIDGHFK